jgi:hypothetical protein
MRKKLQVMVDYVTGYFRPAGRRPRVKRHYESTLGSGAIVHHTGVVEVVPHLCGNTAKIQYVELWFQEVL